MDNKETRLNGFVLALFGSILLAIYIGLFIFEYLHGDLWFYLTGDSHIVNKIIAVIGMPLVTLSKIMSSLGLSTVGFLIGAAVIGLLFKYMKMLIEWLITDVLGI